MKNKRGTLILTYKDYNLTVHLELSKTSTIHDGKDTIILRGALREYLIAYKFACTNMIESEYYSDERASSLTRKYWENYISKGDRND